MLVAVDVPDRATLDGTGRAEAALVAAVLGLVAGAIAVGWRRTDADGSEPRRGE